MAYDELIINENGKDVIIMDCVPRIIYIHILKNQM